MEKRVLSRHEYIFLTLGKNISYTVIYKGEYQKLRVGDKIDCIYEGEEMTAYVVRLHYLVSSENIIEGIVFDEEKYGKLYIYLSLSPEDNNNEEYIKEYLEYKQLLKESKKVNYEFLSRITPKDTSRTKIVMPVRIINPLLMDNVLSNLFNLPKRILHNFMEQKLFIDTLDDEIISRRVVKLDDSIYLTGIEAIEYLYKKYNIVHPILKEEDIFIDEIYVYPQYWKRMYIQDGEENQISFSYLSLINRCKNIVLLVNNTDCPKLVLENEKRMLYEKNVYLLERFINDGLLKKRW